MPTRQRIQDRPELGRNTLVSLNELELSFAHAIAETRNSTNRKENVKDMVQDGKRTSLEVDRDGAEAELAVFKLLGMYPEPMLDTTIRSKAAGTDNGDVVIDGLTVDVKSTRYKTGNLIQSGGVKEAVVDMYCLVIKTTDNTFQIKGFYPAKLLLSEKNYGKHFPGRPCFLVSQKDLMEYAVCAKKVLDLRKRVV